MCTMVTWLLALLSPFKPLPSLRTSLSQGIGLGEILGLTMAVASQRKEIKEITVEEPLLLTKVRLTQEHTPMYARPCASCDSL
jgi:hypothetical protein